MPRSLSERFPRFAPVLRRAESISRQYSMLLWASVVGFFGAIATLAFRDSLSGVQRLLVGHSGSFVEMARALPWQARLLLPCAGGAVAGTILLLAGRAGTGAGVDYMEAVATGDGRVSFRHTVLRSLSSLATIASGGSIGREGSMVQLAALSASLFGKALRFDASRLRLLVACGAAAGISSAYNAPIAGAFFVTEIVLGAIVMESFGPVMFASVVANITMRALPNYRPTYEMPAFPSIPNAEAGLFLILGLLAGLSTPLFLRLIVLCKGHFQALPWPLPLRLAAGGLLVGLLSIPVPEVWGNGYSVVNSLLHHPMLWSTVLTILLFKIVATALTTGSGAVGGIFTPTIFVGAAVGTLFAQCAHAMWPAFAGASFAYAMVGMGAFLAAATGAPLMAIFMIFEMTLSYQIMLPLMLACVSAYFVVGALDGAAMYDITVRRKRQAAVLSRLRTTHMAELVKPAVTVLPAATATFDDASRLFREHAVKYLYLVDSAGRFMGVVASQDITAAFAGAEAERARPLHNFLRRDFLHVLTPDMSLDQALALFLQHEGERLPIVRSAGDPVLLGVIYKSSLLDAYSRLIRSGLAGNGG
jgi:CIC family chloride channel protein